MQLGEYEKHLNVIRALSLRQNHISCRDLKKKDIPQSGNIHWNAIYYICR